MLKRLIIENFAIIDKAEIHFGDKMNVITGETGAGKSILMGALQLILGERADSGVLHKEKKCVVEGIFSSPDEEKLEAFLRANDLDAGHEIVLRREITAAGKSRSFVNDTPVNLSQLKEIALLLVDLHQQFDTLEISEQSFQKMVLDSLAGNWTKVKDMARLYDSYAEKLRALEKIKKEQEDSNRELDYNNYLITELQNLALKENELEQLEAEFKLLNQSEGIHEQLESIHFLLLEKEDAVVPKLRSLQQQMDSAAALLPALQALQQRIQSCLIELRDIDDEAVRLQGNLSQDPARIQWINDRLSEGFRLLKKHGVKETNELKQLEEQLEGKVGRVQEMSSLIEAGEKEIAELCSRLEKMASDISGKRKKVIPSFEKQVNELLLKVGMPNACLKVDIQNCVLDRSGIDAVEFLFEANLSKNSDKQRFQPVGKVASGGELSRLMLCIKYLVAEGLQLPTLIFDEIDTGISGEAAKQVGAILQSLSRKHQLIAITHQPQIAARTDAHYFVYKEMQGGNIVSRIRLLDEEERIKAIARMLGGEKPTVAAIANAREMVEGR